MTAIEVPPRTGAATTAPSSERLPSLTGLRFFAAALVLLYHLTHYVGTFPLISPLVEFGRTGVTFFFVLSGFVLAWTYLRRPARFADFAWRRVARLWPLLACTGLLSLLVSFGIGAHVPAWRAATTFVFLQAWTPAWSQGANGAAWSLSDEAFFYLMFPALLAAAVTVRGRRWLWTSVCVALPVLWTAYVVLHWPHWALDYLPVARVVQFAMGVLAAVAMRSGVRAPLGYRRAIALLIAFHAALIPWALLTRDSGNLGPYSASQWWAAPLFVLLVMAAADRDLHGGWTGARSPWAIRLGHWSYACYLIQEPLILAWLNLVGRPSHTYQVIDCWVVLTALTVGLAAVLYTWVEHPAERWLRPRNPMRALRAARTRATAPSGSPVAIPPQRTPNGIRTRATAVKGRGPGPLDDGGPRGRRTARDAPA